MFSTLITAFAFSVAFAAASLIPQQSNAQCNTGALQCCDSVQDAGAPDVSALLGSLGIPIGDVNVPVGLTCTPIDAVIGVGTAGNCNANPVCCQNNTFNGVVALGCTPATVNV